ncbi:MAG: endonuclease/exonuclease/phosphatase family protein [Treponema sp.]|jgi:endonuclease/exonuclease/phosphatase family metal-dependent hydrolase|nr:endonuclease/exonuclease/phosphatase family protein [Treponema sp.]
MKNTITKLMITVKIIAVLAGCSITAPEPETANSIFLVSWNVQALFDGEDNGKEYAEYRASSGWTEEKYRARITGIADAVKTLGDSDDITEHKNKVPDIIAFIEIENEKIMEDIASAANYHRTFFASSPGAALGLGLVSRFPILNTKTHSAHFEGTETPRPVAEIWVDAGGRTLVLMVCHWKSKLGGDRETEAARKAEAAIIARRLSEIQATDAGIPVIVMGDLNENADEFTRTAYLCALMPDSEEAAECIREAGSRPGFQDFLVISGKRPPRTEYLGGVDAATVLYSPWTEETGSGSYYYNEQWETIDHFLFNGAAFDKSGWDFAGFRAAEDYPFIDENDLPNAYVPWTGNGLSDHLPLLSWLALQQPPGSNQLVNAESP